MEQSHHLIKASCQTPEELGNWVEIRYRATIPDVVRTLAPDEMGNHARGACPPPTRVMIIRQAEKDTFGMDLPSTYRSCWRVNPSPSALTPAFFERACKPGRAIDVGLTVGRSQDGEQHLDGWCGRAINPAGTDGR